MNQITAYRLLTPGTEFYYSGDMSNRSQFGKVDRVFESPGFGTQVALTYDDGSKTRLNIGMFHEVYSGNGSTRFVTKAAYLDWKAKQEEAFKARYPKYFQEANA